MKKIFIQKTLLGLGMIASLACLSLSHTGVALGLQTARQVTRIIPDTATNCSHALYLGHGKVCRDSLLQSATEGWYSFLADTTKLSVQLRNKYAAVSSPHMLKFEIFEGTCPNLSLVATAVPPPGNDTLISLRLQHLIPGNYYFIRTWKDSASPEKKTNAASFGLCLGDYDLTGELLFFQSCGLNYVMTSVALNDRFAPPVSWPGAAQPAYFTTPVSGIPSSCIKIDTAFIWFSLVGEPLCPLHTIAQHPRLRVYDPTNTSIPLSNSLGVWVDEKNATCWEGNLNFTFNENPTTHNYRVGLSAAYMNKLARSNHINGLYKIDGLPVVKTTGQNPEVDVSGATLVIIYEDLTANYQGTLMLWNGICISSGAGIGTINGPLCVLQHPSFNPSVSSRNEKAFFVAADFENTCNSPGGCDLYGINNPLYTAAKTLLPFHGPTSAVMWNAVEEHPPLYSVFGIHSTRVPFSFTTYKDCYNIVALGAYYQEPQPVCTSYHPIITASKPYICFGDSLQLHADAALSYSWSPKAALSCTTCPDPTANPAWTTTYTVNTTSLQGCIGSDTLTVNVHPPPEVSVSDLKPALFCAGTAFTLHAFSANTPPLQYSWTPAASLNTSTGPVVIARPGAQTTYTVTGTDVFGCKGRDTTTAFITAGACCQPLTLPPILAPLNFNAADPKAPPPFNNPATKCVKGGIYEIGPGVTIHIPSSLTYTLDHCELRMDSGSAIVIHADAVLNIINQCHLHNCVNMWKGIRMKPSSALNFNTNSWLEDAIRGVESENGAIYTINRGIFNRNYINIQADTWYGTHQGIIQGAVFTCRDIAPFPVPAVSNVMANLLLDPVALPVASLHAPYVGARTQIGVLADTLAGIVIGAYASIAQNVFDNMDYGIWLKQSAAQIQNNLFLNLDGHQMRMNPGNKVFQYTGIGIFGQENSGNNPARHDIQIGGPQVQQQQNRFFNCNRAIDLEGDYKDIFVQNNLIEANPHVKPNLAGNSVGRMGVYISPGLTASISVKNNSVDNCTTGFQQSACSSAWGNTLEYRENTVTSTVPGACITGMALSSPAPVASSTSFAYNNNTINGALNGLVVTALSGNSQKAQYTFANNSIHTGYKPAGNGTGMKFSGCQYIEVVTNHVQCDAQAAVSGGNLNEYGIHLVNSPFMHVHCNEIENEGRALVFEGVCTSISNTGARVFTGSGILQNTLSHAQDGFVLLNNGVIGSQGCPGFWGSQGMPSDNYWDMTGGGNGTFSRAETFVQNSPGANTNSPLYNNDLRAGSRATFPTLNTAAPWYNAYGPSGLPLALGLVASCLPVPQSSDPIQTSDSLIEKELYEFIADTALFPVFNTETHVQRKQYVYAFLKNDSALWIENQTLKDFYRNAEHGNLKKMSDIGLAISARLFGEANTKNKAFDPQNIIELTQSNYDKAYLNWILDQNPADSVQLNPIKESAALCPLRAGNAVFQARALFELITGQTYIFSNTCDSLDAAIEQQVFRTPGHSENSVLAAMSETRLYPNPNDGNMTLEYSLETGEHGLLMLSDLNGKEILNYAVQANSISVQIRAPEISNGIYCYQFLVNGLCRKTGKLVIIK